MTRYPWRATFRTANELTVLRGTDNYYLYCLFNVTINYASHYRMLGRQRHTPNGAIMRLTHVMELSVEPRTLVLAGSRRSSQLILAISHGLLLYLKTKSKSENN